MEGFRQICHEQLLEEWRNPSQIPTTVHELKGQDIQDFIQSRLKIAWPAFHRHQTSGKSRSYFQYRCMRSGKPTDKSYKRVGCSAYISYKPAFCPRLGHVVLERVFNNHTGHDPLSNEDKHAFAVCPELEAKILEWIELGVASDIMLTKAYEWAWDQGHRDFSDARYFVTPIDLKNLRKKYLRSVHLDPEDCCSLHRMVSEQRKDDVIYYQEYIHQQQALILVLQTPEMKADLAASSSNLVFMDATFSVNKYGYPLWTLMVTNTFGRGVPVAHIISSSEDQKILEIALRELQEAGLEPRAFMLDKDYREIAAVKEVFPNAKVLLCYFHVLQAVHRWLTSRNSSLHGTGLGLRRNDVIHFFAKLKGSTSKEEFDSTYEDFKVEFVEHQDLLRYVKNNWYGIGEMWSTFGRRFNHDNADTNNLAERFFLRLKYQFLGRKRNRRLDDLVSTLLNRANNYFTILDNLRQAGRKVDTKIAQALKPALAASQMIGKGWADKVINLEDGNYIVPSAFCVDTNYCVNIPDCSCTCEQGNKASMCKHVHVVRSLQLQGHPQFGSLEADMVAGCEFLRPHRNLWHVSATGELNVNMLDTDDTIYATKTKCSCIAFSFFQDCGHIRLACSVLNGNVQNHQQHEHQDPYPGKEVEHQEQPSYEDDTQQPPQGGCSSEAEPEDDSALLMLKALVAHYESTGTTPTAAAKAAIKKLHDKVLMPAVGDKRRKQVPLFPNRRFKRIKANERTNVHLGITHLKLDKENTGDSGDHTMAKPPQKRKKQRSKLTFVANNTFVVVRKTTAPSIKKIVARNQGQTGEVTIGGMKLNKAGENALKKKGAPPCISDRDLAPDLEGSFLSEITNTLKLISSDSLSKLSEEEITDHLKDYFKKKYNWSPGQTKTQGNFT